MTRVLNFTIDGVICMAEKGQTILEAATANKKFIPTLCNLPGLKPRGSCRVCNVKINGKLMASCTTPVAEGMEIENDSESVNDIRKSIIELLLVEGNHYCPFCEKSGNCDLQALAYKYEIPAPRFPYQFPDRDIEATHGKLIKDHNRCILCKRCIRGIKDDEGKSIFAFKRRSHKVVINIDTKLSANMTDELAQESMDICPVGAILKKEIGFCVPIGKRKYDKEPIGSDIEEIKATTI
jgi:[NiFe] hydrogenase diaphorase moiety small subunit